MGREKRRSKIYKFIVGSNRTNGRREGIPYIYIYIYIYINCIIYQDKEYIAFKHSFLNTSINTNTINADDCKITSSVD